MAKATHAGGESFTEHELTDPILITRPMLGEVDKPWQPEVGGGSIQSSDNEPTNGADENQSPLSPVPTTESHSSTQAAESSSADSTDGNGPATQERPSASSRKSTKRSTKSVASTADIGDFDDF